MPNGVGSQWELLLAFEAALNANYEEFRLAENVHLASVFGAIDFSATTDLFIPEGATFAVVEDGSKMVDPDDCPMVLIDMNVAQTTSVGPASAAGESAQSVGLWLYTTEVIADAYGVKYRLSAKELVIMTLAFAQAVTSALRKIGAGSVWTAGAGICSPEMSNQGGRAYDSDGAFEVKAIQTQQIWNVSQTVRY